jgi:pimeloyl-ACP methyl ester carboxylesterase
MTTFQRLSKLFILKSSFYLDILLFSIISLFYLSSCGGSAYTSVSEPILLVPGYGSKSTLWKDVGYIEKLQAEGHSYGGHYTIDAETEMVNFEPYSDTTTVEDFYTLSFSDSTKGIQDLSNQLSSVVYEIISRTGSEKLNLVGYSMGGIICRKYVVDNKDYHCVKNLVTIASPHQGTNLANFSYGVENILGSTLYKELIAEFGQDIPLAMNGAAISDLVRTDNGLLNTLNKEEHPSDINYHFIAARSSLCDIAKELLELEYEGDLVSNIKSQTLEVTRNKNLINARFTVINDADHFSILEKNDILQNILPLFNKNK